MRLATLGCKVNQADSDELARELIRRGYRIAAPGEAPAACVINTCTVTHVADAKARKLIRRLARDHPGAAVIVTGCGAKAAADIPGVSRVVANSAKHGLPEVVSDLLSAKERLSLRRSYATEESPIGGALQVGDSSLTLGMTVATAPRPSRPGSMRAFVKAQDGCDHRCSYCIVPDARGAMRSRPVDEVLTEMRALAAAGAREVVICGIRLGAYGEEPAGRALAQLLRAAREVPLARLRLSSVEPWDVGAGLIEELADHPTLCPHLHLPLQSGDDDLLRAMGRPYVFADYRSLVERLRGLMPDIAVSTDLMVGFPGESEAAFDHTCRAVADIGFARAHVFRYSRRPGTRAAAMSAQVAAPVKAARAARLAQVAGEAARRYAQRFVGRPVPVLFEECAGGLCSGLSDTYLPVRAPGETSLVGAVAGVAVLRVESNGIAGRVVERSAIANPR